METTFNKSTDEKKALLIAVSAVFATTGILCLIFHISPKEMLHALANFSEHHFLLTGFICMVIAFIALKYYFSNYGSQRRKIINKHTITFSGSKRRRMRNMLKKLKL